MLSGALVHVLGSEAADTDVDHPERALEYGRRTAA